MSTRDVIPTRCWWWIAAALVAGCEGTTPPAATDAAADAPADDVIDAGATDDAGDDAGEASPWGRCGEAAYRALCACAVMTDMVAIARCQQGVYTRFPACFRCIAEVISRVCCDADYRATSECSTAHGCGDQACIDRFCAAESMAYLRCQTTTQALPFCQTALQVCIADFPRLGMCP